ncbi:MAG: hypothetical protein M3N93_04005 [Acidobacteriota bacterium]|nr:hypothetical protein [Acidobacteriota bacterium]
MGRISIREEHDNLFRSQIDKDFLLRIAGNCGSQTRSWDGRYRGYDQL